MLVRTKAKILLKKKMWRIIFYLIFLIILSYGISNFEKDKAKDEPAKPIGDHFLNKMMNINEDCKDEKAAIEF